MESTQDAAYNVYGQLSHSSRSDNVSQIEFNIHRDDVRFSEFIARALDPSPAYKRPSLSPWVYFK